MRRRPTSGRRREPRRPRPRRRPSRWGPRSMPGRACPRRPRQVGRRAVQWSARSAGRHLCRLRAPVAGRLPALPPVLLPTGRSEAAAAGRRTTGAPLVPVPPVLVPVVRGAAATLRRPSGDRRVRPGQTAERIRRRTRDRRCPRRLRREPGRPYHQVLWWVPGRRRYRRPSPRVPRRPGRRMTLRVPCRRMRSPPGFGRGRGAGPPAGDRSAGPVPSAGPTPARVGSQPGPVRAGWRESPPNRARPVVRESARRRARCPVWPGRRSGRAVRRWAGGGPDRPHPAWTEGRSAARAGWVRRLLARSAGRGRRWARWGSGPDARAGPVDRTALRPAARGAVRPGEQPTGRVLPAGRNGPTRPATQGRAAGGGAAPRAMRVGRHRRPARVTPGTPAPGRHPVPVQRRVVGPAVTPAARTVVRWKPDGAGVRRTDGWAGRRTSAGAVAPGARRPQPGRPVRCPVVVPAGVPAGPEGARGWPAPVGRGWEVRRPGGATAVPTRAGASGGAGIPGAGAAGCGREGPTGESAAGAQARHRGPGRVAGRRGFRGTDGRRVRRDAARRARRARRWPPGCSCGGPRAGCPVPRRPRPGRRPGPASAGRPGSTAARRPRTPPPAPAGRRPDRRPLGAASRAGARCP